MLLVHRVAGGFVAVAARRALQTGAVVRNHDPLTGTELLNTFSDLDNLPGDFVTCVDPSTLLRLGLTIPVHRIAAANAAGHDRSEHFRGPDFRHRHFNDTNIVVAEVQACLHDVGDAPHPWLS